MTNKEQIALLKMKELKFIISGGHSDGLISADYVSDKLQEIINKVEDKKNDK
jgi:hypothetical protein